MSKIAVPPWVVADAVPDSWRLAPAYDLTHSMGQRPEFVGAGPGEHYLDVAGKGKDISREDLRTLTKSSGLKPTEIDEIVDAALSSARSWPELATANGVAEDVVAQVASRLPAVI